MLGKEKGASGCTQITKTAFALIKYTTCKINSKKGFLVITYTQHTQTVKAKFKAGRRFTTTVKSPSSA